MRTKLGMAFLFFLLTAFVGCGGGDDAATDTGTGDDPAATTGEGEDSQASAPIETTRKLAGVQLNGDEVAGVTNAFLQGLTQGQDAAVQNALTPTARDKMLEHGGVTGLAAQPGAGYRINQVEYKGRGGTETLAETHVTLTDAEESVDMIIGTLKCDAGWKVAGIAIQPFKPYNLGEEWLKLNFENPEESEQQFEWAASELERRMQERMAAQQRSVPSNPFAQQQPAPTDGAPRVTMNPNGTPQPNVQPPMQPTGTMPPMTAPPAGGPGVMMPPNGAPINTVPPTGMQPPMTQPGNQVW